MTAFICRKTITWGKQFYRSVASIDYSMSRLNPRLRISSVTDSTIGREMHGKTEV